MIARLLAVVLLSNLTGKSRIRSLIMVMAAGPTRITKVPGKIPSDNKTVTLTLNRNPKLIDKLRAKVVVGFKAQLILLEHVGAQ